MNDTGRGGRGGNDDEHVLYLKIAYSTCDMRFWKVEPGSDCGDLNAAEEGGSKRQLSRVFG